MSATTPQGTAASSPPQPAAAATGSLPPSVKKHRRPPPLPLPPLPQPQQQQPFRWGLAGALLAIGAVLLHFALQWGDNAAATLARNQQQSGGGAPRPSSQHQDTIPRGDEANPGAFYRLRSHQEITPGIHVVNFSTIVIADREENEEESSPAGAQARHQAAKKEETVAKNGGVYCASRDTTAEGAADGAAEDPVMACVPRYHMCTRVVVDNFVSSAVADATVRVMKNVLRRYGSGGGSGPVSLVDLNLGVVSMRDKFVSLFHAMDRMDRSGASGGKGAASLPPPLNGEDAEQYHLLVKKIHSYVSEMLFCPTLPCPTERDRELARKRGRAELFVAGPSFFSQIGGSASKGGSLEARTVNDEYWHPHVDRDQYGTFAITTLLYLNTMHDTTALDTFEGGQFEFGAPLPGTVEPRKGRLSIFTSGAEHPHWVGPVLDGYRYALTTAFTCQQVAAPGAGGGGGVFRIDGDDAGSLLYELKRHL